MRAIVARFVIVAVVVLALAGCASSKAPTWTFAPAPSAPTTVKAAITPPPASMAPMAAEAIEIDAFDLGFAEISEATGLPVGTAKCYAHRGRERLRERLTA